MNGNGYQELSRLTRGIAPQEWEKRIAEVLEVGMRNVVRSQSNKALDERCCVLSSGWSRSEVDETRLNLSETMLKELQRIGLIEHAENIDIIKPGEKSEGVQIEMYLLTKKAEKLYFELQREGYFKEEDEVRRGVEVYHVE